MENGGQKMEDGGWRTEGGRQALEVNGTYLSRNWALKVLGIRRVGIAQHLYVSAIQLWRLGGRNTDLIWRCN